VHAAYSADMITTLPLVHQGKVRDCFAVGDKHLLMVASDRLSAFDVVLPDPIPGKGEMLTRISNFWFELTRDIVPNHLADLSLEEVLGDAALAEKLAPRSMVVKRLPERYPRSCGPASGLLSVSRQYVRLFQAIAGSAIPETRRDRLRR